jgi:hypothetical protein
MASLHTGNTLRCWRVRGDTWRCSASVLPFLDPAAAPSLQIYFQCLRTLIRWMTQEEVRRFAVLDALLIADFARVVRRRRGYTGPTISRETLTHYYVVLIGLYRHRSTVRDALRADPFPGLTARTEQNIQEAPLRIVTSTGQWNRRRS